MIGLKEALGQLRRKEKLFMTQHRIEVIDREYAAILAAKTPAERVAMANAAHRAACIMIRSRVLQLHPEWTDEQRHREFLRRLLGDGANEYLASRG
jgi:Rv0078B-related antitoxin